MFLYKMDKKWRETDTLRFLKLYETEECLWNFKHINYKNKQARQNSVMNIIVGMGMPGLKDSEVRNKIRNIRSTYAQELTKFIKAIKEDKKNYLSTLIWFPIAHKFLGKVVAARCLDEAGENAVTETEKRIIDAACANRGRVIEEALTSYIEGCEDSPGDTEQDSSKKSFNLPELHEVHFLPQDSSIPPVKRKKLEMSDGVTRQQPTVQSLDNDVEDEFFHFAKNVACQLRQLPLKSALLSQTKILDILAKERIAVAEKKSTCPTVLPLVIHRPKSLLSVRKQDNRPSIKNLVRNVDELTDHSSDE